MAILYFTLGCTLKTAWFISRRLREAMRVDGMMMPPMGSNGKVVEADETFIGRVEGMKKGKAAWAHKNVVFALVERGGSARSFHVDGVRAGDHHAAEHEPRSTADDR
jgi:hypothetical protein